jgi:cytochrome c-type biogenesis protein CcmH
MQELGQRMERLPRVRVRASIKINSRLGLAVVVRVILTGLLLALSSVSSHAAIDVYEFKTPVEEQRFQALMGELRCPKCQNQNLAGSDAEIAKDLKRRTYQLMEEGKSDNEIRDYMIERYGDFITYKPPVRGSTYLLWFGPFALLMIVVIALVLMRRRQVAPAPSLTAEESARLTELLKRSTHDQ